MEDGKIKISTQQFKQLCAIKSNCFDKNISEKALRQGVIVSLSLIFKDLKLMCGDIDVAINRIIRDQKYGYYK